MMEQGDAKEEGDRGSVEDKLGKTQRKERRKPYTAREIEKKRHRPTVKEKKGARGRK